MDYKQPIDLEKEEVTHIELSNLDQSRAAPSSISYPAALRDMAEPPDTQLLKEAHDLIVADQTRPMGATFKTNWRLLLCTAPFYINAWDTNTRTPVPHEHSENGGAVVRVHVGAGAAIIIE